jgi:hypothetical protein
VIATYTVGGYADGVLGCTTDAGQIAIISGWNFYAGSDATQIGSGQYDFQTVVTHELGHALGLGHSTDGTSVMYATLNTGMVNRSLTTADLNVPDSDTTGACGLHTALPAGTGLPSGNAGSTAPSGVDGPLATGDLNLLGQGRGTPPSGNTPQLVTSWAGLPVLGTATEKPAPAARITWPDLPGSERGTTGSRPGSVASGPGANRQSQEAQLAEIFAGRPGREEANQVRGLAAPAANEAPWPVDDPLPLGAFDGFFAGLDQPNLGSMLKSEESPESPIEVLTALRTESTLIHSLAAGVGAWALLSGLKEVPEQRRERSGERPRISGRKTSYQ